MLSTVDTTSPGEARAAQNISNKNPKELIESLIHVWYSNKVGLMDLPLVDKYRSVSEINSYTQMIWAKTFRLGCGFKIHSKYFSTEMCLKGLHIITVITP